MFCIDVVFVFFFKKVRLYREEGKLVYRVRVQGGAFVDMRRRVVG